MSKRRAGTELTHDNWDKEEEQEEEAGVFKTAEKDIIAKRAIKKAKRRFAGDDQSPTDASSSPFAAFKGFSGFSAAAAPTKKPNLAFGGGDSKPKVAVTPAGSTAPVISAFVIKTTSNTSTSSTLSSTSLNGSGSSSAFKLNMNSEYSKQLRSLNQSVSAWIQTHVNANPLCDLTPVFEDYKKHLGEIEKKYSVNNTSSSVSSTVPKPGSQSETTIVTAAAATTTTSTSSSAFSGFQSTTFAPSQSTFSFKPTSPTGTSSVSSGFNFKSTTASEPSAGGAVGQVKPFSFGLARPSSSTAAETTKEGGSGGGGDENEPPKVEFKQVEEKDALYSKRCKVFYKKDDTYKDRGVGMLHLKKTGDRGQMLIRADTNLGNVILNVGIHSSMPATRQGKNNVLIMTAMNPPITEKCPKCKKKYPQPQESNKCDSGCTPEVEPLLLRVKTSNDADQLLEEINKLKE